MSGMAAPLFAMSLPWWQIALGVVSMHVIPGAIVGLTFQLTHISDGNEFPSLDAQGRRPQDGSQALPFPDQGGHGLDDLGIVGPA